MDPRDAPKFLKDPFFGELYLRSTLPFLSPEITRVEAEFLARVLNDGPPGAICDIGCGHGRHATPLAAKVQRPVIGIDLDRYSLQRRTPGFHAVRGDFFHLPFRDRSLGGLYAWYSTLFVFEDAQQQPLFRELHRVLKPGGRMVVHTVPWDYVAAQPQSQFDGTLPDGSTLVERSIFDPATGRDNAYRILTLKDGRALSGTFFIRHYPLPEMLRLLGEAGFEILFSYGTVFGGPVEQTSQDLIIGVGRKHDG